MQRITDHGASLLYQPPHASELGLHSQIQLTLQLRFSHRTTPKCSSHKLPPPSHICLYIHCIPSPFRNSPHPTTRRPDQHGRLHNHSYPNSEHASASFISCRPSEHPPNTSALDSSDPRSQYTTSTLHSSSKYPVSSFRIRQHPVICIRTNIVKNANFTWLLRWISFNHPTVSATQQYSVNTSQRNTLTVTNPAARISYCTASLQTSDYRCRYSIPESSWHLKRFNKSVIIVTQSPRTLSPLPSFLLLWQSSIVLPSAVSNQSSLLSNRLSWATMETHRRVASWHFCSRGRSIVCSRIFAYVSLCYTNMNS